jgi:hypothetical protein
LIFLLQTVRLLNWRAEGRWGWGEIEDPLVMTGQKEESSAIFTKQQPNLWFGSNYEVVVGSKVIITSLP